MLVLRDVLGWSAREAADVLDVSVAAANSALQRARERVERERREGTLAACTGPPTARAEAAVMRRFVEAWEAVDIERLTALLADDALMTMPPEPIRVAGGGDRRLLRDRADGRAARPDPARARRARTASRRSRRTSRSRGRAFRAYGIMVFALDGDRIAASPASPDARRYSPSAFGIPFEIT